MATILQTGQKVKTRLRAWHTVGRHPSAHLFLDDAAVSASHAAFRWSADGWEVRDLGSTNGTFVEGRRLEPGESTRLQIGMQIRFGTSETDWQVVSLEAPVAAALSEVGGIDRLAEGDVIALPSWDDARVLVYRDGAGSWWRETDGDAAHCRADELIVIGSDTWRLDLPTIVPATGAATLSLDLALAALEFTVSPDEEFVAMRLVWPGHTLDLGHRAQHYTLLLLARHREEERTTHGDGSGWLHPDSLCSMLRCRAPLINLHIHRARRSLAVADVRGAGGIVERRPGTRELRLGVAQTRIETLAN